MIIPSHNGERWLSGALQSLVEQKECGIEVIVVDTSAGDVSLQIAESYSERLNIRAYRRPDLLPWTAKTNFGESGELYSFRKMKTPSPRGVNFTCVTV